MLIGEYQHSLDAKGRFNFPAKLRESLGDCFYVTKGMDGCLAVYSEAEWKIREDKLRVLMQSMKGRWTQRDIGSMSYPLEPDNQGRVLIPANLRELAGLDKNVVIVGVSDRVEIWDKKKWDERPVLTEEEFVAMMESVI